MSAPVWKWDVTSESTGTELVLTSDPFFLLEQSFPMPDVDVQYASSVDSTRDALTGLRYKNRTITLRVRVVGSSASNLETQLSYVAQKVAKTNADTVTGGTGVGATLQYTSASGDAVVFDVVHAQMVADTGQRYVKRDVSEVTITFECLPFWRGAENTPSDHTETSLPTLTFTEATVDGDVPALGRLVVDEDQAKDQLSVVYGLRSKNYSADATAALFWQAEALTAVAAGATAAAGPSGASGSGSNTIYANALTTTYQDLLKSTVSTTYWTHVGAYRVIVRAQAKSDNTGTVTLRAKWAQADVTNYTTGTDVELPAAGSWARVDLGVITIPRVLTGTQRWELRVQGKSSVNLEDVYVDWVWLVPVDECSGVAEVSSAEPATTQTISDEFDRASGNLDGDTPAPQTDGNNWAETTAGEFTTDATYDYVKRTNVSDGGTFPTGMSGNAKFAVVGSSAMTGSYVQCDMTYSTAVTGMVQGVILRYTDASNWVGALTYRAASGKKYLSVVKCVAGTETTIAGAEAPVPLASWTVVANVTAAGTLTAYLREGTTTHATTTVSDTVLATGGTLASGKVGIVDYWTSGTASTRTYDNFIAGTITSDAACFASQSIQVRHDGVVRSTASGIWTRPARFDGDYLLVPPSGREARTVEVTVGMSRTRLGEAGDSGVDDLSAKLYVTPRGLQLPS